MMIYKKFILILTWQVFIFHMGTCQSGFLKYILENLNTNVNVDDILFDENKIIIRGNLYLNSLNLYGTFVAELDTLGQVQKVVTQYDTSFISHMITKTPTRFSIGKHQNILIPNYYFDLNELGFTVIDSSGLEKWTRRYPNTEFTIYPFEAFQADQFYYLFGIVQRSNYLEDDYMLKLDSNGNSVWFKYLGVLGAHEHLGKVIHNADNTFTISSMRFSNDYYQLDKLEGWRRPWLYTVDTAGTIINEWRGELNDTRTLGGGPTVQLPNGDWIIVSTDRKLFNIGFGNEVWYAHTISRLDTAFNLIWKDTLIDFAYYQNKIVDMEYDSIHDELVLVGDRYFKYPEKVESEIWALKMKPTGEVLWEITDTLSYHKKEIHYTAGLSLSPSGSIYVAGYYKSELPELHTDGWLMKISPDGCVDSLCEITGLADQIRKPINSISFYPNPTRETLHIQCPEWNDQKVLYTLSSLQGVQIVHGKGNFTSNEMTIDFSTLRMPPGMWILQLKNELGETFTGKVILQD